MIRRVLQGLSLTLPLAVLACSQVPLNPVPVAPHANPGLGAAETTVGGVNVIVQGNVWPGALDISTQVTPLRLTISNNSGRPVRFRYGDIALIAADGEYYAALPPFEPAGLLEPGIAERYESIITPGFIQHSFELAPHYEALYPRSKTYEGPFFYDPLYYDRYYTYWRMTTLPNREMLELALPEGILRQGGELSGFVYFEHVPRRPDDLNFRMALVDASTGYIFGEILIPLPMEGG